MLMYIFLFLDFLALAVLLLTNLGVVQNFFIALPLAIYLALKGVFFRDVLSIMDAAVGVLLVLVSFGVHTSFVYAVAVFYVYKFIVSVFLK